MKIIDPTVNLIFKKEYVYNKPKEISEVGYYVNKCKISKETNA